MSWAAARIEFEGLQIIWILGQCALNLACGLAHGSLTNQPPILAVLPCKIRSPANDQQMMADQPDGILLRHEPCMGARLNAELPCPNLTERLAILLKPKNGD
jgi:hypothetical protein